LQRTRLVMLEQCVAILAPQTEIVH
jgi:hypothetical protein